LNEAAFEFPETVLKAVKKEVWYLFDTAFELMSHGMNLHRTQILQSADLRKTIDEDREVLEFDMEQFYETRIKALYGAIIEFISRSQAELPNVFAEEMFRLRKAATEIVESVKHVKHLRKNVTEYMLSDNRHIRDEYNRLRYQIAVLLREIYSYREQQDYDDEAAVKHIKALRKEVRTSHGELSERIFALLRDRRITPEMATSLLNDFNYVDGTLKDLVDSAKALLSSHEELLAEAAEDIDLNEQGPAGISAA
jgi:phosphate:Na+ symporter